MSTTSSNSPPHLPSTEKKHWWLSTKKIVDKYVREARVMISTREQSEINSALSQLEAALFLSPKYEPALELKARCLLYLRRYKEVADMLQDYIPSYKMSDSDDSSGSSSDNSNSSSQTLSRERVKLLGSSSNSDLNSSGCDYSTSFKCFSVSDLKKKVLSGFYKNCDKEGQWRYSVLGQACCHLGLMEDALVLLQHGKRLASAAFRRESICWSDDSFAFTVSSATSDSLTESQPLTETESISHLIAHIKLLLRRRAAALAALDAGLFTEAIRHFSKILEGRRPAPQAFLAESYLHRASAYKSAGRTAESIADLNRALALEPTSTVALQSRAGLFEFIGCITDSVHDLEHVKLIYNSILRDRKPPGPVWKPRAVPYREIPGRLCSLGSKIQQLKQRIAMGETGNVDYFKLIGLRRGCSRSELDLAHLLLVLRHKPEKSMSFLDRCELADERDFDSVKDRARMSAVLLFRLVQKAYSNVLSTIVEEEAVEAERRKTTLALQQAQAQAEAQAEAQSQALALQNIEARKQMTEGNGPAIGIVPVYEPEVDVDQPDDRPDTGCDGKVESFPYQGVFCRDLAAVGSLLSQVGFNRPITVKYEALSGGVLV
ncbi:hypothetical protein SOVF_001100 [Spinacia oleracea]|nr:hypothetical protein SOVF_001100 [Spinacia oleracea]